MNFGIVLFQRVENILRMYLRIYIIRGAHIIFIPLNPFLYIAAMLSTIYTLLIYFRYVLDGFHISYYPIRVYIQCMHTYI